MRARRLWLPLAILSGGQPGRCPGPAAEARGPCLAAPRLVSASASVDLPPLRMDDSPAPDELLLHFARDGACTGLEPWRARLFARTPAVQPRSDPEASARARERGEKGQQEHHGTCLLLAASASCSHTTWAAYLWRSARYSHRRVSSAARSEEHTS